MKNLIIFRRYFARFYKKAYKNVNVFNVFNNNFARPLIFFQAKVLSLGEGQNFERRNVERPIFRNIKIANIKITRDELFDSFIFELIFLFLENFLNTRNIQ